MSLLGNKEALQTFDVSVENSLLVLGHGEILVGAFQTFTEFSSHAVNWLVMAGGVKRCRRTAELFLFSLAEELLLPRYQEENFQISCLVSIFKFPQSSSLFYCCLCFNCYSASTHL